MIAVGVLLGLVVAALAVALCLSRVRRLHRLHIRVDAARAGSTRPWPVGRRPRRRLVW